MLQRFVSRVVDAGAYVLTLWRLWLLDRWHGAPPETPADRAIREEGEQLRKAFPGIDFDDPTPRTIPPERHG